MRLSGLDGVEVVLLRGGLSRQVAPFFPSSVELRELEEKLRAGYMNKERAAQLMEKEAIRLQEEVSAVYLIWKANFRTTTWCRAVQGIVHFTVSYIHEGKSRATLYPVATYVPLLNTRWYLQ